MKQWASQRIFQSIHGKNLVYNTCWEDPRLDRQAMKLGADDRVAMITSAGCNALDYLLDSPSAIHCVDVNPRQNALLELKVAAIRELDNDQVFKMFGRGHLHDAELLYQQRLRRHLHPTSQAFWDRKIGWFSDPRRSFIYRGTSGTFARGFSFYLNRILRVGPLVRDIFAAPTLDAQSELFEQILWPRVWRRSIRSMVSRDTTLALLGVPRPQRVQVERYCQGGIAGFIESCMRSVFAERPLRDNYFYHAYLLGGYSPSCCPEYIRPENLDRLRSGLLDRIHVHTTTMESFLRQTEQPISRFVLLDHMDWLANVHPDGLVAEWEAILGAAAPQTRILWRSGGPNADFLLQLQIRHAGQSHRIEDLLRLNQSQAEQLHQLDRVATYASFYIADLAA